MKRSLCFLIFIFCLINCFSQNRNNTWYFGQYAGIDFNANPPTALHNSMMYAYESSSTICDNNGNILFYTNGDTVWNKNHVVMQNGTGLLSGPGTSATQGVMIVPKPCDNYTYYIFTVPEGENSSELFCYSIVDITQDGGLGAVTVKNIVIHHPVVEKLAATLQANGIDYWIVVEESTMGNLLVYSLTATGLDLIPVINNAGGPTNNGGYLRFSHDGARLCEISRLPDQINLFDFNKTTGVISNPIVLLEPNPYGAEFSPDNTKLYSTTGFYTYQYDLSAGTQTAIQNSQSIVATSNVVMGALKLGPDHKIYAIKLLADNIGVIDQPNQQGAACNFIDNIISFSPARSGFGLPNNIDLFSSCSPCPSILSDSLNVTICSNQAYQLSSGLVVNATGFYQDTIKAVNSCDSIINTIHLRVNNISFSNIVDSIYEGAEYILPSGQTVSTSGIYQSVLTNSLGCDSIIITTLSTVKQFAACMILKNAFTPNGDGVNDFWVLYKEKCFKKLKVDIYNRYGSLVYHSDDYKNDWNGKYKNQELPDGTYYYYVKMYADNGDVQVFKNNVTILR